MEIELGLTLPIELSSTNRNLAFAKASARVGENDLGDGFMRNIDNISDRLRARAMEEVLDSLYAFIEKLEEEGIISD